MTNKGTAKPYVKCIGASSTGVTQSCYVVRFKKYVILLDCGMYQESDIATNYKENLRFLKKIKVKDIDFISLSHLHNDHSGLIPALYARGCQAHLYAPSGSTPFLRLLWEDSMKIMQQDCQKLNNKGTKASPFYTQEDIERALDRIIEVDYLNRITQYLTEDMYFQYFPANHIIHACQVYFTFVDGYVKHYLGFTGDIGGQFPQPYVCPMETMPYCNLLLGENTYNNPERNRVKSYYRKLDLEKIQSVVLDYSRILIPCFSLGRTQTILTVLYQLWKDGKLPQNIVIYLDSPLAQKFCDMWPTAEWKEVKEWSNIHYIQDWAESQTLQKQKNPCIIVSASGMLNGGRSVEWAKTLLPDSRNCILFCGYSSDNTLASQIRHGDKIISINGESIPNNANIVELTSFSSHASYDELWQYYTVCCRFDKLALIHGDMEYKPEFCRQLQNKLHAVGKSSRVICVNEDTKIYF